MDAIDRRRIANELARRQARDSLHAFARYVWRYQPAAHHDLIIEALEAIEAREIKRLLIIAPPGHAKSTYASMIFPSWYLGRHPSEKILGISTTDDLAALYHGSVMSVIENSARYEAVFRDVRPDKGRGWSRKGLFLTGADPNEKDASIVFIGAGGGAIGRRANLLIDDPVDEDVARSPTLLEARKLWLARTAFSRLDRDSWAVMIGTIWTEDDVMSAAAKTGDWTLIRMKALADEKAVHAEVNVPEGVEWRPYGWQAVGAV